MDGGGEEAKERNPGKAFVVFSMKPQKTNDASYIKVLQYPAFYVFSVTKSISREEIKNKIADLARFDTEAPMPRARQADFFSTLKFDL